jgi:SAM-dependent methyltransferase
VSGNNSSREKMTGQPEQFHKTLLRPTVASDILAKEYSIRQKGTAYYIVRDLKEHFGSRTVDVALEVGGGLGANMVLLKRHLSVINAISTDLFIPENPADGIDYMVVPADKLTEHFSKNSVDLVLMSEVIEHIFDPDTAIMQVKEILKPNGVLLVTTPNLSSLVNRIALLFGYLPMGVEVSTKRVFGRPTRLGGLSDHVVGHIRPFTFSALTQFLSYYGFRIKRAHTVAHLFARLNEKGELVGPVGIMRLLRTIEVVATKLNPRLGYDIVVLAVKP